MPSIELLRIITLIVGIKEKNVRFPKEIRDDGNKLKKKKIEIDFVRYEGLVLESKNC